MPWLFLAGAGVDSFSAGGFFHCLLIKTKPRPFCLSLGRCRVDLKRHTDVWHNFDPIARDGSHCNLAVMNFLVFFFGCIILGWLERIIIFLRPKTLALRMQTYDAGDLFVCICKVYTGP